MLDILEKLKDERERKERVEDALGDDNWDDVDEVEDVSQPQVAKKQPQSKPKKVVNLRNKSDPDDDQNQRNWPMDIEWPQNGDDDDDMSGFSPDEKIIFIK